MAMVYDFIDFCFVIKASDEGATSSKFITKASHCTRRRFYFNTIIVHMHATSMSVGIDVCQPSIYPSPTSPDTSRAYSSSQQCYPKSYAGSCLGALQSCMGGGADGRGGTVWISSAVNVADSERQVSTVTTLLQGDPGCLNSSRRFLCQYLFPPCDGNGTLYLPTYQECVVISTGACKEAWQLAQAHTSIIKLPDCGSLPNTTSICSSENWGVGWGGVRGRLVWVFEGIPFSLCKEGDVIVRIPSNSHMNIHVAICTNTAVQLYLFVLIATCMFIVFVCSCTGCVCFVCWIQPIILHFGNNTTIRELAIREVASTIRELASTIREVASTISEVASTIREVASTIRELASTIREVASTIREVASTIRELASTIREVASTIRELASTIREVASTIREVASTIRELASTIREVASTIREVASTISEVASIIREVASTIREVASIIREVASTHNNFNWQ